MSRADPKLFEAENELECGYPRSFAASCSDGAFTRAASMLSGSRAACWTAPMLGATIQARCSMEEIVALQLDAPGLHPESVDPVDATTVALRFFQAVRRIDSRVSLRGLFVRDKCLQQSTITTTPELALPAVHHFGAVLQGTAQPRKGESVCFNRFRESVASFESRWGGRLGITLAVGEDQIVAQIGEEVSTVRSGITTFRAFSRGAKLGANPRVFLETHAQSLTLSATNEIAEIALANAKGLVSVRALMHKHAGSTRFVRQGTALRIRAVAGHSSIDAWRAAAKEGPSFERWSDLKAALYDD